MARRVDTALAPARERVGVPVAPDGSRRRPLLLRLSETERGACNNGCRTCLSEPVAAAHAAFDVDVAGKHVVVRHREATLDRSLPAQIAALKARGPASIALLTNGRALLYTKLTARLRRAGLDRVIVKLFGNDAGAHDAHTRVPSSFAQALSGIAAARAAGLEVHVTFPLGDTGTNPASSDSVVNAESNRALAEQLTGAGPVVLPEPEVEAHPNEFRYDVVEMRPGASGPLWDKAFFPMVHVQTGPACNLRCTYCNVHGGDDQRLYSVDQVRVLLDAAARHILAAHDGPGVPTVDFIGGEPTLHPELPRLIEHARAIGFEQVLICTNGMRLARPGYLDSLVAAGLTGVRYSFHEHHAGAAADLADVGPGVGPRYLDVARLLLARPEIRTHFYRIILASTIDTLPAYVRWLAEHNGLGRPVDLTFGLPSMRGRLFDNPHLYPPLDALRAKVGAAFELAKSLGLSPILHHAPACVIPERADHAACTNISTHQVSALDGSRVSTDFEGDARYGRACEGCPGRTGGCHGVPAAYWEQSADAVERWLTPLPNQPPPETGGAGERAGRGAR